MQIGLLLIGTAAGAPFLPKLAQIARADVAFAVGLMAILMLVTIVYLPIVLPLLVPGIEVSGLQIALSLIVTMLLPLVVGLLVKARYEGAAQVLQPVHPAARGDLGPGRTPARRRGGGLAILFPVAGEFGRRGEVGSGADQPSVSGQS